MLFKDLPIQKKLIRVILLISGVMLLVTCTVFFTYEFYIFRQSSIQKLSTLGKIISTNSTAALAFDNKNDAFEILSALKAEPRIEVANLYDDKGKLFSQYPKNQIVVAPPVIPVRETYGFKHSRLEGFQPVILGNRRLGTLYLQSNLSDMYERFELYGLTTIIVIAICFLLAYLLSRILQKSISGPVLALSNTARAISNNKDYSVRALKLGDDELGNLTDAFNTMLNHIQEQNIALSNFNQKLEQRVVERTAELEAVNKELEAFSYSVSHDLRAPLRAVNGYARMMIKNYGDSIDAEAIRMMSRITISAQKMGQLIDDLLAFSRLGRRELVKTNISMNNMVTEIWNEIKAQESNRNIEFIINDLPPINADSVTMKQVWINLISNALKYSRFKEKAIIEIGAETKEDEVIYYIKDNGAGFDMRYANKLFGVFQRLHTDNEFEGTGVGLAIVYRIIARHGGRIWAQAKLDEGAQFYFSLNRNN